MANIFSALFISSDRRLFQFVISIRVLCFELPLKPFFHALFCCRSYPLRVLLNTLFQFSHSCKCIPFAMISPWCECNFYVFAQRPVIQTHTLIHWTVILPCYVFLKFYCALAISHMQNFCHIYWTRLRKALQKQTVFIFVCLE